MKKYAVLALWSMGVLVGCPETFIFSNGGALTGTIIRTNGDDILVLADFGAFNFRIANIKEIRPEKPEASEIQTTNRLPDFKTAALILSHQTWASHLTPIPATVIEKGIFRNVPYLSFRCGDDYEVNVYGDLSAPAAIEAGVYRKLLKSEAAKRNCINLVHELLGQAADKEVLERLSLEQDRQVRDGLTFEITPPAAEDAYDGWWVSVYSEKTLNGSRASDKELNLITSSKSDTSSTQVRAEDDSSWSAEQMKLARPSKPETITVVSSSGEVVTNAEVVRVVDGAYLIWRRGTTVGRVKLADLGEDIRLRLGYDPSKAGAAYSAEERRVQAEAPSGAVQQAQPLRAEPSTGASAGYSTYSASSGTGRVFVHAYTRKDGTYVQAHTRSYPRR